MLEILVFLALVFLIVRGNSIQEKAPVVTVGWIFWTCMILGLAGIACRVLNGWRWHGKEAEAFGEIFGFLAILLLTIAIRKPYYPLWFLFPAGNAFNFLAMASNKWRMPVDPAILFHYSTEYPSLGNRHSIANASTRCWYLIDRIYNPWLMLQILSIGDLLLFAGIFITAVQVFVILHRKRHS